MKLFFSVEGKIKKNWQLISAFAAIDCFFD